MAKANIKMSSSNLYANYGYGKYQTGLRNDVQKMRRKLQEIEWRKEREQLIIEEEQRKARELEKLRQQEAERKEIERKTKRYFAFDNYDRKKLVKDRTSFFGDHNNINGAWRPDGHGQVIDQTDVVLDGEFKKGDFLGGSVYFRSTEQTWQGAMKGDLMQGYGTVTTKTYRKKTAKDLYFSDDHLEPGSVAHSGHHDPRPFSLKAMKASLHTVSETTDQNDEPLDSARRRRMERDEQRKDMVEEIHTDDVLVFNGEIMCKRSEVVPGVRIEFFDDQYAQAGVSDSTQLATTNLSPPRHTRNSAVHRIEAIRGHHERLQGINDGLPKLQLYHVPGPNAAAKSVDKLSSSTSSQQHNTSKTNATITEDVYQRNPGPRKLNALDRGHFSLQATVIEHRRDWKYLVRLDDEVYPRDRILDLQHLGRFRLMREQPKVYHLHSFPAVFSNHPHNNSPYRAVAHPTVVSSNFFDDDSATHDVSTLGNGHDLDSVYFHSEASADHSSTLSYNAPTQRVIAHPDHPRHTMDYREHLPQHQVTSRPLLPMVPSRSAHARRQNYFETALMGIGATQEAAELKAKEAQQRQQWKRFIEDKKKAFEADRQRQIEEEQARQLQASVAKAVEDKIAQAQHDAEEDDQTRRSALTSVYSEFGEDDDDESNDNGGGVDGDVRKR